MIDYPNKSLSFPLLTISYAQPFYAAHAYAKCEQSIGGELGGNVLIPYYDDDDDDDNATHKQHIPTRMHAACGTTKHVY